MSAKWGVVLLLGLVCASSVDAGSRGRVRLVRGGASRSVVRQIQQYQQQMQKEEARLAAQEEAALKAAEQKRHELHESAATANRAIRQHVKERGDRNRKRAADSVKSAKSTSASDPAGE